MPSQPTSTAAERLDRDAIILRELKQQLEFVAPSSTAPLSADESAKLEQCIEAFLMRFLRAKHLSVSEAASKLRRRRVFESTLPSMTVTPSVVACLRSGALRIVGRDTEQRLILFLDARQLQSWPSLSKDDAERLTVLLCLYMEHRCMLCAYDRTSAAHAATASADSSSPHRHRQQMVLLVNAHDVPASRLSASLLRHMPALQPIVSKYFPQLIDLVLVTGAPYATRQAIQGALSQCSADLQRAVEMLQDKDLTRFMDAAVIPSSLGGGNQGADQQLGTAVDVRVGEAAPSLAAVPGGQDASEAGVGVGSTSFAEVVMRHWYLVTAFLSTESALLQSQPDCPQRPLYLPPPLQFMPPTTSLAVMMKDQSHDAPGTSPATTPSPGAAVRPVFPFFMAVPATVPTFYSHTNQPNGTESRVAAQGSRLRTSSTRRQRVPGSATSAARAGGADVSPVPVPPSPRGVLGRADVEPTTIDDGLCSSLVSSAFVDDVEEDALESSFDDDDRVGVPLAPHTAMVSAAGAELDPAEAQKVKTDPEYALKVLRHERGRRLIAEQRVQLAQLGLTMDPHNTSLVERELASIHESLNILVGEVLVRSREAVGPKAVPSLAQLLDVTVGVLESSVQEPQRIPVVSAFAQPVQRDEGLQDNATGGGCCCTAM